MGLNLKNRSGESWIKRIAFEGGKVPGGSSVRGLHENLYKIMRKKKDDRKSFALKRKKNRGSCKKRSPQE